MSRWTIGVVLVVGCGLLIAFLSPRAEVEEDEPAPDPVYICRDSGRLVSMPFEPAPAVNPDTGKRTLYLALYCDTCKKWHAVPPPDVYRGNPFSYPCPVHHQPMAATGPMNNQPQEAKR